MKSLPSFAIVLGLPLSASALAVACSDSPDDVNGDNGAGAGGSLSQPMCDEQPYPSTAAACPAQSQICLPTSRFDCCTCNLGHDCGSEFIWVCHTSDPACPEVPPTAGTPCELGEGAVCIYCSEPPAVNVGCHAGRWATRLPEAYCSTS